MAAAGFETERLDHLGIVAGVCQQIGLAAYLDAFDEQRHAQAIAITYGYLRDRRADLKQWMLGLLTTHDGDVPVGMQALDGNASDRVSLPELLRAVLTQLIDAETEQPVEEEPLFVADSALGDALEPGAGLS